MRALVVSQPGQFVTNFLLVCAYLRFRRFPLVAGHHRRPRPFGRRFGFFALYWWIWQA